MLLRLHASGARPRPTLRRLEPSLDRVAANLRAISEVEKESAIAVAIRHIGPHFQVVRVHDSKADGIARRDVVTDLTVIGVHVVDCETQITQAIAAKRERHVPPGNKKR